MKIGYLITTLLSIKSRLNSQAKSKELSERVVVIIEEVLHLLNSSIPHFYREHTPQLFSQQRKPIPILSSQAPSDKNQIHGLADGLRYLPGFESKTLISKECLESLRTRLHTFIQNKAMTDIIGRIHIETIHAFLVKLAMEMPINNEEDYIFGDINPHRVIYISSGHKFDLKDIVMTLHHFPHRHPYTNEELPILDLCHIIKTAITYYDHNKKEGHFDEDTHIALFLESLRFPRSIVYVNQLLFLLDKRNHPYQIYSSTSYQFDLSEDKIALLKSNMNICQALYEGLISLEDIRVVSMQNLELVSKFHKSLDLLRGEWRQSFLTALKTDSKNTIFSTFINCEVPMVSTVDTPVTVPRLN